MADLYSQYTSGTQFIAGAITGSALGVSGLNPIVDAVNASTTLLANKTSYTTVAAYAFSATNPDTNNCQYINGYLNAQSDNITFLAGVQLPDGAVITGAILYGSAAGESWELRRNATNGTVSNIAGNSVNSEDTIISNATVDNSAYSYFFDTSSFDTNDRVYFRSVRNNG